MSMIAILVASMPDFTMWQPAPQTDKEQVELAGILVVALFGNLVQKRQRELGGVQSVRGVEL